MHKRNGNSVHRKRRLAISLCNSDEQTCENLSSFCGKILSTYSRSSYAKLQSTQRHHYTYHLNVNCAVYWRLECICGFYTVLASHQHFISSCVWHSHTVECIQVHIDSLSSCVCVCMQSIHTKMREREREMWHYYQLPRTHPFNCMLDCRRLSSHFS